MVRWMLPGLALSLSACHGGDDPSKPDDSGTPGVGGPADVDEDGVTVDSDCNDNDAAVFPGAAEACNGLDDDCNGTIDEGLLATFYRDMDSDGFGDVDAPASACGMPAGYVTDATDCDDHDVAIHPDAAEVCDLIGTDEDCNGAVNEADAGLTDVRTWYVDADEDGFGSDTTVEACFERPGLATLGTDCDDADGAVNPAVPEVCDALDKDEDCDGSSDVADPEGPLGQPLYFVDADGDGDGDVSDAGQYFCDGVPPGYSTLSSDCDDVDGAINPRSPELCRDTIDNDCNGAIDDCGPIADISLSAADTILYGTESYEEVGWDVSDLGDLDGDGDADFGASSPWGSSDSGKVLVFSSPVALAPDLEADAEASAVITGSMFSNLGWTTRSAGDVDSDGFDDLIVGAYRDTGTAYVLLGPIRGTMTASSVADATWSGEEMFDEAGQAVDGGFDYNSDGFDDYVIAAHNASGSFSYGGAAYLVYGPGLGSLSLADADARVEGNESDARLGSSVAGLGDTNGDGTDDMAIGAEAYGPNDNGRAYIFTDDIGGILDADSNANAWIEGNNSYANLGFEVADGGDFNDDGYADLLVGAPGTSTGAGNSGSAYVFAGPMDVSGTASSVALAEFYGETSNNSAGQGIDGSMDVNRDGYSDVLVGAPYADGGAGLNDAGATYLVYGPQSGANALSGARCALTGTEMYQNSGQSAAFIGDQDGDASPEILVGAPYTESVTSGGGAIYVVFGGRL